MATTWLIRSEERKEFPPKYGSGDDCFTLKIHYGGRLYTPHERETESCYHPDEVIYVDWVDGDKLSVIEIHNMLIDANIQIDLPHVKYFWRKEGQSLVNGLVPLVSDADVVGMAVKIPQSKVIELYVEDSSLFDSRVYDDIDAGASDDDNESENDSDDIREYNQNFHKYSKIDRMWMCEEFLADLGEKDPFPDLGDKILKGGKQKKFQSVVCDKSNEKDEAVKRKKKTEAKEAVVEKKKKKAKEAVVEKKKKTEAKEAAVKRMDKLENENESPEEEDSDKGTRSDCSEFKDDEYDFFDDDELDDSLYDLTVDFEAKRGFRLHKKNEKDASTKHDRLHEDQTRSALSSCDDENKSGDTNYEDSDTLRSLSDSDEEQARSKPPRAPEFNVLVDINDPKFKIGMKFGSKQEFNKAVKVWCIKNRFDKLKQARNSRNKMRWVCKAANCPFFIHAGLVQNEIGTWQIKTMNLDHNCGRGFSNCQADYKFLGEKYIDQLRDDPNWSLQGVLGSVRRELGIEISRHKAWRLRKHGLKEVHGDEAEQFKFLRRYGLEVMKQSPGSTVCMKCEDQRFQRLYICLEPLKKGFIVECRRIISLDGCFLKGRYGGQLLTAVGIDANDCIYPIAWAIVESENKSSWEWFLTFLAEDLRIENSYHWTFMTDKQKGLIPVINELFSGFEHRFCVRHMYNNFKSAGHTGKRLKDLLWNAARASYVPDFEKWMEVIKNESLAAYEWLNERPPQNWSRSHFTNDIKCDMLLNNLCECFNKFILAAREKPFISCLEMIMSQLMRRIQLKRDAMKKHHGIICPKIVKNIEKLKEDSLYYTAAWSGGSRFGVDGRNNQYVVDLDERTCACRRWELNRLPCPRAIACIRYIEGNVKEYVDDCYKVETYLKTYEHILSPINGKDLWPTESAPHILPPLVPTTTRDRPTKARKKTMDEIQEKKKKKKDKSGDNLEEKWTKKGAAMHCSICKLAGHNARTHSKRAWNSTPTLEVPSVVMCDVPTTTKRREKYKTKRSIEGSSIGLAEAAATTYGNSSLSQPTPTGFHVGGSLGISLTQPPTNEPRQKKSKQMS